MKHLLTLLALGGALSLGVAHATTSPAQAAQQNKMTTCNAQARTDALKGDARQAFMKECLSKHGTSAAAPAAMTKPAVAAAPAAPAAGTSTPASAPAATQQAKMKTCNAEAKTKALSGAARKTFMSACLKG